MHKRTMRLLMVLGVFCLFSLSLSIARAAIVPCHADLDQDADMDGLDMLIFVTELAISTGPEDSRADLDRDGSVDSDDIALFCQGFGRSGCPEIAYKLYGINFSPYMDGQSPDDGSPISEDQIRARMVIIAPFTHWVRSFSTTDGLERIGHVAHQFGLKTAVGAWLSDDLPANALQMQNLIQAAQAGDVDLAIAGSEVLLRGDLTPAQLMAYIDQFRAAVPGIPVGTADVYEQLLAHPEVMAACDIITVNYYPFWDKIPLAHAIAHIHDTHQQMVAVAGGKEIIVSETGWPSAGDPNCAAVPSLDNAGDYLLNFVSWARDEDIPFFYFEAFDELWKSGEPNNVGPHWGIWDKDGFMKSSMAEPFSGFTMADNWSCQAVPGGSGDPRIVFSYVPPYESFCFLFGRVLHVQPQDYRVAVYIRVNSGWWTKPTFANPTTDIDCHGFWTCNITTGGIDETANTIAAFLVPDGYAPPLVGGQSELPDELYQNGVANVITTRSP